MRRQQCMAQMVSFVVITVCVLVVPALAADCPELVGRWPYGPSWAVAVSGNHVYFGSGTALVVAELSDASTPQVVGDVALPDPLSRIAVSDGFAYGADWRGGFRVIDVRTPSAPAEVAFLDAPGQVARDVAVSSGCAYIADDTAGRSRSGPSPAGATSPRGDAAVPGFQPRVVY